MQKSTCKMNHTDFRSYFGRKNYHLLTDTAKSEFGTSRIQVYNKNVMSS